MDFSKALFFVSRISYFAPTHPLTPDPAFLDHLTLLNNDRSDKLKTAGGGHEEKFLKEMGPAFVNGNNAGGANFLCGLSFLLSG
jgi:hypothetical protein